MAAMRQSNISTHNLSLFLFNAPCRHLMIYMSFFYRCSRWFHRQVTGGSVTEQGHHVCRTGLVHSRDPWAYPARKHTALWVVSRCYLSGYLHPGCHLPFIQGPRTGGSYREVCLPILRGVLWRKFCIVRLSLCYLSITRAVIHRLW